MVLIFTLTQLAIPLIVRAAVDDALLSETDAADILAMTVSVFALAITINYAANHLQELIVGRLASQLLFDLRHAMVRVDAAEALESLAPANRPGE